MPLTKLPSRSQSRVNVQIQQSTGVGRGFTHFLHMLGRRQVRCAGATHDSVAFSVSSLESRLREGIQPSGQWIAGDDAYIRTENLITPMPSTGIPQEMQKTYLNVSFLLSHAFGMLVARWGIFWKPLRFSLWRSIFSLESQVVEATRSAALCGLNSLRALESKEFLVIFVESSIFHSDPVRKSVALFILIHPLQ